ncbi:MAG: phosphate acyltransferase PlsX [Phycisphaerae bacterium]
MRIGIDAMGGDGAPANNVGGALAARDVIDETDKIILIGQSDEIRKQLPDGQLPDYVEIVHADQVVGMDEAPVDALRQKPNSSIAVMAEMHRDGKLDAIVSAGNTGACVAAAQMRLRRLPGVHRPGICILTPTYHGPVAVADVGANVNCRPSHLHQYGVMAGEYMRAVVGVDSPRVGLLSIGEEDSKGNSLVKEAAALMRDDEDLNFIGNVEGRDLFRGICDVMVCEGFVGNVVLKLMEGMAEGVLRGMFAELTATLPAETHPAIKKSSMALARKYDYNDYGGAPLLGVAGILIICHGASNEIGIRNAVRVARESVAHGINSRITELLNK